ncbi:hypothetical protein MKK75_17875 [Methylobacterium sp. J-030]|uniref:hypothetical protein n=1 Tax=Methylobacterium sp. J-030 TaxID=2836627 RepID=UPI001FBAAF89|nr:hypothetical protein [Methylobacterium sp. J-030]MCJ2070637.1 hypothetical protein [Methylobacterium sp. J-030]
MSLRTSLKNLIHRDPGAALRERADGLRGSLSRRTVVAGTVAVAVPLPVIAGTQQPSAEEAAFLALVPAALPILRRLIPAQTEMTRLDIEAEAVDGGYPGPHDEGRRRAWADQVSERRQTNGFGVAWEAANAIDVELTALVEDYDRVPMRTPTAILFKIALEHLGEWWGESALDDLRHLAAERFDLPDDSTPTV